ncbi:MAG: hypothetical protein U1F21_03470 [Sphaerotilus natans]
MSETIMLTPVLVASPTASWNRVAWGHGRPLPGGRARVVDD